MFYGRLLNMKKQEILCTPYGEMCDMVSCFSIFRGAEPKAAQKHYSYDEAMRLL